MGCDIHTVAQVYQDGKWDTVADNIAGEDRSYHSYAILADVRNDGWPVIAPPRDVPEDFKSQETEDKDHYRVLLPSNLEKWLGDHSHSWLLLSEMVEFLEKTIKPMTYTQKGVVTKEDYLRFKNEGTPFTSWSAGVGGGSTKVVDESEIEKYPNYTHVNFQWPRKAEECVRYFVNCVEELTKLSQEYEVTTDKVRFVFGFDS